MHESKATMEIFFAEIHICCCLVPRFITTISLHLFTVEKGGNGRERNGYQHSKTNWLLSIDAVCAAADARHFSEVRTAILRQIRLCSACWSRVLDPFLPEEALTLCCIRTSNWSCLLFKSGHFWTPTKGLTHPEILINTPISQTYLFFQHCRRLKFFLLPPACLLSTLSSGAVLLPASSLFLSVGPLILPAFLRCCFCLPNSPLSLLSIFVWFSLSEEGWGRDWKGSTDSMVSLKPRRLTVKSQ